MTDSVRTPTGCHPSVTDADVTAMLVAAGWNTEIAEQWTRENACAAPPVRRALESFAARASGDATRDAAELESLRGRVAALREYCQHGIGCDEVRSYDPSQPCSCGLDALLADSRHTPQKFESTEIASPVIEQDAGGSISGASRETAGPTDEEVKRALMLWDHDAILPKDDAYAMSVVLTDFLASRSGETGGGTLKEALERVRAVFPREAAEAFWASKEAGDGAPDGADYEAALFEMERAYDMAIFTPLDDGEIKKLVKAMGHNTDVRAPSDRLHAQWGRHLTAVIRRRAEHFRVERSDTPNPLLTSPVGDQETPRIGDALAKHGIGPAPQSDAEAAREDVRMTAGRCVSGEESNGR